MDSPSISKLFANSYPRMSDALRALAGITRKPFSDSTPKIGSDWDNLITRIKVNWSTSSFNPNIQQQKASSKIDSETDIVSLIAELRALAKIFAGSDSSEATLCDTVKFVLNLFTSKTTTGGFLNSAEQSRVRATFGQIPSRSDLQRADVLVARLSRGLKPDVIRALCDEDSAVYNGPAVAASARTVECSDLSKAQLFGSDIAVNPPDYRTPHFNLETALGEEEHVNFSDSDFSTASTSTSSSDFEADDRADDAIQSLWPALSEAAHSSSKAGRPVAPLAAERSLRDPVAQVLRTLPRFSLDDALLESVERSVLTHLSSSQSDDAIQNDLLELVGFEPEELECVGELIRLRADLQLVRKSTGASKTAFKSKLRKGKRASAGEDAEQQDDAGRVIYTSCDDYARQALTEEKDREFALQLQEIEQLDERADVREPQSQPPAPPGSTLAGGGGGGSSKRLPFVFDQMLECVQTAAYIGSSKILLPESAVRRSSPEFEEYTIPAPPRQCPVPQERYVPVSELDGEDRAIFESSGVKRLNAMQSVVFNAAYRSNENLLVCAPTGAGKTNVALLCVLRAVRVHRQSLAADDDASAARRRARAGPMAGFKVVYVAPMKALAAEMTATFAKRLAPLGLTVREMTGDTQLTRAEIEATSMLVVTPEKWDVVTRKGSVGGSGTSGGSDSSSLALQVRLLILDEVHLLHDDRGPVLEAIVARTLRLVETSQQMIRIIGLSATLPNYEDVADFLRVNPQRGLFFFDARFRPVPLSQTLVGIKCPSTNRLRLQTLLNRQAYEKALSQLREGHQVMIFVHARNDTVRTAVALREMAREEGTLRYFRVIDADADAAAAAAAAEASGEQSAQEQTARKALQLRFSDALKRMLNSRNKELKELFAFGFGIHHAGMLRHDRHLVEKYFGDGLIKCLVCTSTLAWGVNLPAHAVIIKGTEVYDAKRGGTDDLSVLDVQQILGRAGRPQFDTSGVGVILTTHSRLAHYLALLMRQTPIESQLLNGLVDALNAEIALGSVQSVDDALRWLRYTYLFIRLCKNPRAYGYSPNLLQNDPTLADERRKMVQIAAQTLDRCQMVRYVQEGGRLQATDLGRIASHFYIRHQSVEMFNEHLQAHSELGNLFALLSSCSEFEQIKSREEEIEELEGLESTACFLGVRALPGTGKTGPDLAAATSKVNVLMQAYVSRASLDAFSLVSDASFVAQNVCRIARALFEIALRRGWPALAARTLELAKCFEHRLWPEQSPLRQFVAAGGASNIPSGTKAEAPEVSLGPLSVANEVLLKLESSRHLKLDQLAETDVRELAHLLRTNNEVASRVQRLARCLPQLSIETQVQPLTRSILKLSVTLTPSARWFWHEKLHAGSSGGGGGANEQFWLWVEDPENDHIYYHEQVTMTRKQVKSREPVQLAFAIPIFEPLPSQYLLRVESDRWIGCSFTHAIAFARLVLPTLHPPHTKLLDLQPLHKRALHSPPLERLFRFEYFNPVQTQFFHALYCTDQNVLIGAPTGSGKTVAAELAFFRVFRLYPHMKCVYVAPLKALVRERMRDWEERIERALGRRVVELTGDVHPDIAALRDAAVIVTTPEKWDCVSRAWRAREHVRRVRLIVFDEIHLLGDSRGPVLETIVSRVNFIVAQTGVPVRLIGLSTALANARDLADWLNVGASVCAAASAPVTTSGASASPMAAVGAGANALSQLLGSAGAGFLFNFHPSVRPVTLEVHIAGFAGKNYCPRMATMNKPCYLAIREHSPDKPVLIFVSSRRQTRLTALDLIAFLAADDNPKQWLHMSEQLLADAMPGVRDVNLRMTLEFGIGLHHAGLHESDRVLVERLYVEQKIQVLVATATLAWGVNYPAHLVIVKGTEFFDGKERRYVDYPITDVLQMIGRAGRPQFDQHGVAVVFCHDIKKHFFKRFLYEPFPVESSLLAVLADHINAEIVAGTLNSRQDIFEYLTWTYFFRRLLANPSYYNLEKLEPEDVTGYLYRIIDNALGDLEASHCTELDEDGRTVRALPLGRMASYYYVKHQTVKLFADELRAESEMVDLISVLSNAHEYDELPLRHNEDVQNEELSKRVPLAVSAHTLDSPHTKAHLLLQAHFERAPLPISDYVTDTKSVLDQALRLLQCLIDCAAERGLLACALRCVHLLQQCVQGAWAHASPLLAQLPALTPFLVQLLPCESLPELLEAYSRNSRLLSTALSGRLPLDQLRLLNAAISRFPILDVSGSLAIVPCLPEESAENEEMPIKKPPQLSVSFQVPLQFELFDGDVRNAHWVQVPVGAQLVLQVDLMRVNSWVRGSGRKAYAPRMGKPKDEGYVLIVGCRETRQLLGLRRVLSLRSPFVARSAPTAALAPVPLGGELLKRSETASAERDSDSDNERQQPAAEPSCAVPRNRFELTFRAPDAPARIIYTLYVLSDAYIGLDQQYDIFIEAREGTVAPPLIPAPEAFADQHDPLAKLF